MSRAGHEGTTAWRRRAPGADPDAIWRPGGATVTADPAADVPSAAPRRRVVEPGISPWSREAVEAPLPTAEQIQARRRRELDLDRDAGGAPDRLDAPRRAMSVPLQPATATTTASVLVGLGVACLVALALLVAWAILPPGSARVVEVLPADGVARWQVAVGGSVVPRRLVADEASVAVVVDGELIVFDARTGADRWHRPLAVRPRYQVALYDTTVVAVAEGGGQESIAAFDVVTGASRWERDRGDTVIALQPDGLVEYLQTGSTMAMRVLDPATGGAISPASVAVKMVPPPGYVIGRSADTLVLFDATTGAAGSPAVPGSGLAAIAPVGDRVVGLTTDGSIVLFGPHGTATDRLRVTDAAGADEGGRADLVGGVPGTSIGVVAGDTSTGFTVASDGLEIVWEMTGRVGPPVETERGPIAIAHTADPATGAPGAELVDVRTGTSIADPGGGTTRESDPIVLHDGYLVAPAVGDPDRTLAAFGFDGVERWSLAIPSDSWYDVVDGTLYVVDPSAGTLSAFG